MTEILNIPVPSLEQIIVGTELVFILYIPKKLVSKIDSEIRKERNRIIHNHVKTGHGSRFKHCPDETCASLRNPQPAQQLPLAEALDTDL